MYRYAMTEYPRFRQAAQKYDGDLHCPTGLPVVRKIYAPEITERRLEAPEGRCRGLRNEHKCFSMAVIRFGTCHEELST